MDPLGRGTLLRDSKSDPDEELEEDATAEDTAGAEGTALGLEKSVWKLGVGGTCCVCCPLVRKLSRSAGPKLSRLFKSNLVSSAAPLLNDDSC